MEDTNVTPFPKEKTEKKAPPLATEWVKENSAWFNKPGYRKETAMAYGIDAELTEEGWDVHDPGYYDEMTKRLKSSGLSYFNKSEEFKPTRLIILLIFLFLIC